jgi:hypothetical protein
VANNPHNIDLSSETTSHPEGHRILVWLWVIGLLVLSGAIWGIAEMIIVLTPHGMARSPLP